MRTYLARLAVVSCSAVVTAMLAPVALASATSGQSWRIAAVFTEPPQYTTGINDVAASSAGNAWAGGQNANGLFIERWDGHAWSDVTPTARRLARPGAIVGAVATTSARDAWALASSSDAYALRWNGRRWTKFSFHRYVGFRAAAALSSRDVWAFGITGAWRPFVSRYNGRAWRRVHSPAVPFSVSARSPSEIWMAGPTAASYAASPAGPFRNVISHWTGRSWRSVKLPRVPLAKGAFLIPSGVVALNGRDVWVAANSSAGDSAVLLNWNGRRWRRFAAPQVTNLAGMTPDGHGGLWLASEDSGQPSTSFVHFAAKTWTVTTAPSPGPGASELVSSLALVPGTTSVWASGSVAEHGNDGIIFRYG